ncbi:MAG: tetratricopeptide repeat protein, partial [bacterium]|nr:tetratricopeptide repeat protein [bacterium]
KPAETRRKPQPPEMDFLYWRRYVCGESDADAAWNVHEIGVRLYPAFEKRLREHYGQAGGEPWLKSDSGRMERLAAEGKWQQLRPLAFDEQKRRVRRVRFHSTALFDLLREKSREEGRRDRQRGVEVAELALISLEGSDEIFGERIHDLRALGWAWLGNAQVLALDFSAADVAFEKADFTWGVVRKHKDPSVVGSLRRFKGALRMYQRDYTEALRLIEESVEVFRREDDNNGKARSLIQRATIYSYTEDWVRSVASFSQAALLLEDQDDSYLAFTVSINLANALAQAGQHGKASKSLSRTRLHYRRIDYPNGAHEIEYVDGFINDCAGDLQAAETLYSVALSGFCKTRARLHVALCSLDLMNLYSRQSRQEKVMELGPEAIASMASLNLHHETVAAMKLLTEALQVGEVSHRVVQGVRVSLQIDPLASLPQ